MACVWTSALDKLMCMHVVHVCLHVQVICRGAVDMLQPGGFLALEVSPAAAGMSARKMHTRGHNICCLCFADCGPRAGICSAQPAAQPGQPLLGVCAVRGCG